MDEQTEAPYEHDFESSRVIAEKDAEIERLRALVFHYADQAGVPADEARRVHNV